MLDPPPGSVSLLPFGERSLGSHVEITVRLNSISGNLALIRHHLDEVGWNSVCVGHALPALLNDGNRGVDLPIAKGVLLPKSQAKVKEPPEVNRTLLHPQCARMSPVAMAVGLTFLILDTVREQLGCFNCHFNDMAVKVITCCENWVGIEKEDVHVALGLYLNP